AQFREAVLWMRAVLSGMITANLIVGAAVCGTQVDVLVLVALHAEGDSYKAACAAGGAPGRSPRQFHLDLSLVKHGAFYDCVGLPVRYLAVLDDFDGAFALIIDRLNFHSMRTQLIEILSRR